MIGIRTPFRISFVGGSSDLPIFYKKYGGKVISTTINKYMYHFIHKYSENQTQIKYSKTEIVNSIDEIEHPIVKAASNYFDIKGLDINSIADIPKGSGLASSSSYTVGLVNGLSTYFNDPYPKNKLAEIACDIELQILKEPIGKQDQYAVSFGGLNQIVFHKDDKIDVNPIGLSPQEVKFLESSMVLIKTGISRNASEMLKDQQKEETIDDNLKKINEIKLLVEPFYKSLLDQDLDNLGKILSENWQLKKTLSNKVTNPKIESIFSDLKDNKKIYGGKLLGAGGGGYILLIGEPKDILKLPSKNIEHFKFENSGSSVVFSD